MHGPKIISLFWFFLSRANLVSHYLPSDLHSYYKQICVYVDSKIQKIVCCEESTLSGCYACSKSWTFHPGVAKTISWETNWRESTFVGPVRFPKNNKQQCSSDVWKISNCGRRWVYDATVRSEIGNQVARAEQADAHFKEVVRPLGLSHDFFKSRQLYGLISKFIRVDEYNYPYTIIKVDGTCIRRRREMEKGKRRFTLNHLMWVLTHDELWPLFLSFFYFKFLFLPFFSFIYQQVVRQVSRTLCKSVFFPFYPA